MPIAHNSHRLTRHADYQQVYKVGRKQYGKQMAYFYRLRPGDAGADGKGPRIGLTVPKALGKAVDRNRIKRRMREAVRSALPRLTAAVDVVLHPRRSVIDVEFAALRREVGTLFGSIQAACERAERGGDGADTMGPPGISARRQTQAATRRSPQIAHHLAGASVPSAPTAADGGSAQSRGRTTES